MSAPEVDTDELRWLAETVTGSDVPGDRGPEITEAADEIDRLRHWKAEAIEVLAAWDEVHRVLGSPARPGQSIAAASKAEVERLRAYAGRRENDVLVADRHRGEMARRVRELEEAIVSHRASARLAFLNDLPRSGFDSILWSVLNGGGDSNG